jgi:hypothetical protein
MTMPVRRTALILALAAGAATRLPGQGSPFGINGLGVPGRPESAHARATGGAFAMFDPFSALTDVSVVGNGALSASALAAASYVTDDLDGVNATRRNARFPLFQVSGPAWGGVILGGGIATYLDRSYRVSLADTVILNGSQQAVTDVLSSDGGVTDIRIVAARRFGALALGVGYHLLSGSSRLLASRTFADTSQYRSVTQVNEVAFRGSGISGSAMLTFSKSLQISGFARSDTRLRSEINAVSIARNDLPTTLGAGLHWQIAPEAAIAASVTHASWATAVDSNAYNTTNWSAGAEFGSFRHPIRLGARGGQLPFGPGGQAPREFAVALGTGIVLAQGRGIVDLTLERSRRTGGGLVETSYTALFGVTVRP